MNKEDRLQPTRQDDTRSEHGEIETDPDKMDSIRRDRSDDIPAAVDPTEETDVPPAEPDTPNNPDSASPQPTGADGRLAPEVKSPPQSSNPSPHDQDHSEGGQSPPLKDLQEAENLPRPPEEDPNPPPN